MMEEFVMPYYDKKTANDAECIDEVEKRLRAYRDVPDVRTVISESVDVETGCGEGEERFA